MKTLLACVLFLALGGCASGSKEVWVHPERTGANYEQDEAQCNFEIGKLNAQKEITEEQQAKLFNDCMKSKGWKQEKR